MEAVFKKMPCDWKRKPYFDYYYYTLKTKYTLTKHIDISFLLEEVKQKGLKFYPVYLYVILKVINKTPEFRMSFDPDGNLGTWNYVNPSYTIFHKDDNTFSDLWSEYKSGFQDFYEEIVRDMDKYKDVKEILARKNKPRNFCPMSAIPWLSYESFSQDSYSESSLLFPLIKFGKYYKKDDKVMIPFSVFVNHAVADGYHTCKLINDIEKEGKDVKEWINT